jgi:ADP-heptose:LPS heptosyltransferase
MKQKYHYLQAQNLIFDPESIALSEKTKVLIIRFSSIGDVVLTTPVVRCLKEQLYGENEIHFVVKKQFADVLRSNPYIDRLHILENDDKAMIEELKKENFHYIIDLHNNLRSHLYRRKLNVLSFSFRKLNIKKWILVNFKWDLLPDIHIVDRYFEAVTSFDIKNDGKGLDYFIPAEDKVDTQRLFGKSADNYIAFPIGGAHAGKKLPPDRLVELCGMIRHPLVLLGGREDQDVASEISLTCPHVIDLCGELRLNQSASVLKQARLVISHDSGLMHIASAFKKKIISIWGATVPKFGMYPYDPHPDSVIIEADHLKFRPTSKLGNRNSKKERRTTAEINLKKVSDAVEMLWAGDYNK